MQVKRAIGISVAVYFGTFLIGGIVALTFQLNLATVTPLAWFTSAFSAIILSGFGTWWYFRGPVTSPSAYEGAKFGSIEILTGFVMDTALALPTLLLGQNLFEQILLYYQRPLFWFTLVCVLLAAILVGHFMNTKTPLPAPPEAEAA